MKNKSMVSVPRELLKRALSYAWFPSGEVSVFDMRFIDREQLSAILAAPPEDVRAVVDERTPQDYAIKHAEYLAAAADGVQEAYKAYSLAQMNVDEGGDEGESELTDLVDGAREDLHEALENLRSMTHQFRKRRDRAKTQGATGE